MTNYIHGCIIIIKNTKLEQKAEALNLSIPEYLRQLIKKQKIVQPYISHQDAREIICELKALANLQNPEIISRLDKIYEDITDRKAGG